MIVNVTNDRSRDPVLVPSPSKLSNGVAIPNDAYHLKLKEMLLTNDDAYDAVSEPPGKTKTPSKVIHFRRFFEQLQLMGNFWDTSGDSSIAEANPVMQDPAAMDVGGKAELPCPSRYANRPHKRLRLSDQLDTDTIRIISNSESIANNMSRTIDEGNCQQKQHAYTGKRTSTGSKMPESYRIDTVRFFLEPLIWEFGCRSISPKILPRLQIQNLLIPVRPLTVVYRIPLLDRGRAILGELDGPIMGVQCRAEAPAEKRNDVAAKDLLREVSAMLFLAQERSKVGEEERVIGKGQWWAEKPRWGGKIAKDDGRILNRKEKIEKELKQTKKELRRMSEVRDKKEKYSRENQDGKSGGVGSRENQDGQSGGSGSREHQDGQSGGSSSREHQDGESGGAGSWEYQDGKAGGSQDMERKDGGRENHDIAEKTGFGGTVREEGRDESRQSKGRDLTRIKKTDDSPEKETKKEWREKSEEENLGIEQTKEEKEEIRESARRKKNGKGSNDREEKQGDHHTNEYAYERQTFDEKPKREIPPTDPISRAKAKALRAWAQVKRPSSRWDKKITYLQMGKAPGEEEDSARTSLSFVLLSSSSLSALELGIQLLTV